MGVREQLSLITEALEHSRNQMNRGLNEIIGMLNADSGKIWRIKAEWFNGHEMVEEDLTVMIYTLHDPSWQPRIDGPMPYGYGEIYSIRSYTKQWHPAALDAKNQYDSKYPFISGLLGGEARDVSRLISLPDEVGKFYESWQEAAGALTQLPQTMDNVMDVDTRVTWSGPGYTAYRSIVEKTAASARAAQTAINQMRQHSLDYVEQGLSLCEILRDVATMQANNIIDTVQSLSGSLDPKKWLSIVNTLVDAVQKTNDIQQRVYDAGIRQLSDVAGLLGAIEDTFQALATATGSPTDDISWPEPHYQLDQRWDGAPA